MKKLVAILLLVLTATTAMAQHHGHRHGHGYWHRGHNGWTWVVPAIIGGAVVYGATRPDPVIVQQQPVIVQPPPVQVTPGQNCSPWTETLNADGTITRTRTCAQ
jgi:hypothetical protein